MIQIRQEGDSRFRVLDNEILLASFSDISKAKEYAALTESRLSKNSSNEKRSES